MNKKLFFLLILIMAAVSAAAAGYRNITSREAQALVAKRHDVFLLDVRTPDEYRQARLRGARLIPIDSVERRLGEIPKNVPIVVYCAVGSRSVPVAGLLAGRGYREVYNMSDGIVGWYRNGLPIER